MRVLLKSGADINVPDSLRWRCLDLASYEGNIEAVKLLLEAGDDPSRPIMVDSTTYSAFHAACLNNKLDVAVLLFESGIETTLKGAHGNLTSDIARAYGHADLAVFLSRPQKIL
jgi:ankyrin repeat protein